MTRKLLNIYFTAGYPKLDSTVEILRTLDQEKVDFIEVGIPYSDPLADGPTIQASSKQALENGIDIDTIFDQLLNYKCEHAQLVVMAYYNSILRYGMDQFVDRCKEVGIGSLIIPDLPFEEYKARYELKFREKKMNLVFLVAPSTDLSRIDQLAKVSRPFLYVVSSASTTGTSSKLNLNEAFFQKIKSLNIDVPCLTGFNISDKASFDRASEMTQGGIIGSAFIRHISDSQNLTSSIQAFISNIRT